MSNTLVVIPTFNERENINPLLNRIFSLKTFVDVLILDDNSPDGTKNIVLENKKKYRDRLHLINRGEKQGLGKAYIEGFKWSLKGSYKYIFEMDADFSHSPKDLEQIYKACSEEQIDLAIGSRYKGGINVVNWPLSRILLSYLASCYVRLLTNMPIKDPTAGFVCYKRSVLESIDLDRVKFVGYAFQIEMKYKAYNKKFKIKEIPIIFTDRARGVSKLTKGIIMEAVIGVIRMRFQQILGKL